MSSGKKKSLFERAIDALTNRDEREAARSKATTEAARKAGEGRARMVTEKAADQPAEHNTATEGVATERLVPLETRPTRERIAAPEKGVVTVRSLRIRADHSTNSEVVGGLVKGDEVTILSTWTDGRDTWAQLDRGWAAMVYRGETYIQPD